MSPRSEAVALFFLMVAVVVLDDVFHLRMDRSILNVGAGLSIFMLACAFVPGLVAYSIALVAAVAALFGAVYLISAAWHLGV